MTAEDRDGDSTGIAALRAEIDAVERSALRRIDPGIRASVIACAIMVLLLAVTLPWVGDASGWDVLRGTVNPADRVGLLPRLFGGVALGSGVGLSVLALLTRRWGLAWVSALGCTYCTLDGVWAIWSRQTEHGRGPGIGLVLAELAMAVLAAQWVRLALSRR
ncbi:MAG: Rv2732c family membrane protein [Pseudonocardiaceae bacterium]